MSRRALAILLPALLGLVAADRSRDLPGRLRGATLLPNGWRIAPAGRHVAVGDLPLAMAESADGRYLVVSNNGYATPTLTIVDLKTLAVKEALRVEDAWLGLAWSPRGDRLYSSGGGRNSVMDFEFRAGALSLRREIPTAASAAEETSTSRAVRPPKTSFVGGIAVSRDGARLYAVDVLGQTLSSVGLSAEAETDSKIVPLEAEPYTVVLSPDGATLFVSLWGGARVALFDPVSLVRKGEIEVGEHPNAMEPTPDGRRLFVACANTNSVWALDLNDGTAVEQISTAVFPGSPPGSTPNALGLSPDARRLLVADADNNAVAVVDVSQPGKSRVVGFVPTGWYPTAVKFSRDGHRIFVLSGKGLASKPNPGGPQPGNPHDPSQYIGTILKGALSVLPAPDDRRLAAWTRTVSRLTPHPEGSGVPAAKKTAVRSPIPRRAGEPSPIRHVFYVIRENRTYDQILGDVPEGNGDASLCLFGEDVTPNAHALAKEFVLLDNFYVNAEVSYNGHAFSTAAYATDVVQKVWPMNYGRKTAEYLVPDSSPAGPLRNPYGNLSASSSGYIWDACRRAGVSVRSYGEFVFRPERPKPEASEAEGGREDPYEATVPGLKGAVCPTYPGWDLSIPDNRRLDVWLEEFHRFEEDGNLPALSIVRLPNDHTSGAKAGSLTPRSMIAENDLALGRLVEAISKGRYWEESAIFVLEDDAQNGPDHVDAHRSVAFVASPWARRGVVDSSLYTTCGTLHTIERILGLTPMSQCDAAAATMAAAFQSSPDARPFVHREPRVPLDEKNAPTAWGAGESERMDLAEADRAPERELNEIVWRSVRGADCPMPPPVRSAWVRPAETEGDRDDN